MEAMVGVCMGGAAGARSGHVLRLQQPGPGRGPIKLCRWLEGPRCGLGRSAMAAVSVLTSVQWFVFSAAAPCLRPVHTAA